MNWAQTPGFSPRLVAFESKAFQEEIGSKLIFGLPTLWPCPADAAGAQLQAAAAAAAASSARRAQAAGGE